MNTVQLECFIAVAEHLSFSKASKALKITQPAVSHQIQTLEEELETKLFRRTSIVFGEPYMPHFAGRRPTAEENRQFADELLDRIYQLKEQV